MSEHPPAFTLGDGAAVTIRPVSPADRDTLRTGFERLSEQSRYRRFLTPLGSLSEAQLDYLTDVDHRDHEALVAVSPGGEGIGVARFVRSLGDPRSAEFAIAVVDDWQGRGVGKALLTALLTALSQRAREEDVHRFTATVLSQNRGVLQLLGRLGDVRVRSQGGGTLELAVELEEPQTLELEFDVPPEGRPGAGLRRALRAAARGHLRPSGWRWIEESTRSLRRRLQ